MGAIIVMVAMGSIGAYGAIIGAIIVIGAKSTIGKFRQGTLIAAEPLD
jgi:hypothetical protein